jgi:hypothetical protein
MMQYEVYGRPSRGGGGVGSGSNSTALPVRRRAGGGDGSSSKSHAGLGTSAIGAGVLDEPKQPLCQRSATGAIIVAFILLVVGLGALAVQQAAALGDLESRITDQVERVQQIYERKLTAALARLDDAERTTEQMERQLIALSKEDGEHEEQRVRMEEHFLNLNQAVVELMKHQPEGGSSSAAAAVAAATSDAAARGASARVAAASTAVGGVDLEQWTERIVWLEAATDRLEKDVQAVVSRADGVLDEQVGG